MSSNKGSGRTERWPCGLLQGRGWRKDWNVAWVCVCGYEGVLVSGFIFVLVVEI
jgi:hypothetical protein